MPCFCLIWCNVQYSDCSAVTQECVGGLGWSGGPGSCVACRGSWWGTTEMGKDLVEIMRLQCVEQMSYTTDAGTNLHPETPQGSKAPCLLATMRAQILLYSYTLCRRAARARGKVVKNFITTPKKIYYLRVTIDLKWKSLVAWIDKLKIGALFFFRLRKLARKIRSIKKIKEQYFLCILKL